MSLDAFFGKIFSRGTAVELEGGLNFEAPLTATRNTDEGRIDISIDLDAVEARAVPVRLRPVEAAYLTTGNVPVLTERDGVAWPVDYLAYPTAVDSHAFWKFAFQYGGGSLRITLYWASDADTSGSVTWQASIGASTPGDAESYEAGTLGTAVTGASACLGTTARRLTSVTLDLESAAELDNIEAGDLVVLRLSRLGSGDTLAGYANLAYVEVTEV